MKTGFIILFILITGLLSAQTPLQILKPDSARKIVSNPNSTSEELFYGYRVRILFRKN